MKCSALVFLIVLGLAFGSSGFWPNGIGAAKDLHHKPNFYIIGGEIVHGREFPGMISLEIEGSQMCGASILNANYILTAAHCSKYYHPSDFIALSGTNLLDQGGTRHNVTEIHIHEEYNERDSWRNDISIMKVEPPFVFDNNTAIVKLPQQGQVTPAGSNATVIGWGEIADSVYPNNLRKVNIFISDHEECVNIYGKEKYCVYPEQICADTPNGSKGSCYGDSGGPLFVNGEVIGLVSWAMGCAWKGYPTVFTEVADYIDWIESKINS